MIDKKVVSHNRFNHLHQQGKVIDTQSLSPGITLLKVKWDEGGETYISKESVTVLSA